MATGYEEKRAEQRRAKMAAALVLALSGLTIGSGLLLSILTMDWRPIVIGVSVDFMLCLVALGALTYLTARAEK